MSPKAAEAAKMRKAMLVNLRRVVRSCTCEWPIVKYRNGHGHDPDCPAVNAARLGGLLRDRAERDSSPLREVVCDPANSADSGRHLSGDAS